MARGVVQRPKILIAALAGLTCAAAALGFALVHLHQVRAEGPVVVAVDKDDLAIALDEAPWISSNALAAQGEASGHVLRLVTAPDCDDCRAFERTAMSRLLDAGVEIRAIPVAPREIATDAAPAREVAALVKDRDWTGLDLWMQGARGGGAPLDPYEQEGMLEWSRQSAERIEAVLKSNGREFGAPAMFWKHGEEWRALTKAGPGAFSAIERELAPGA